jgi:hypothetical protein
MVRFIYFIAATAATFPSTTYSLEAPSPVPAPLLAFDPIPTPVEALNHGYEMEHTQHTQDLTDREPRTQSHYAYNRHEERYRAGSAWNDEPCCWCHGDYYPCRCAEKGKNTASMAQESSPPHSTHSVRYRPRPYRNHNAQLARLSAIEVTIDGTPCKWCLGTFVPCFCEDGAPDKAVQQFDHDPLESSETLSLDYERRLAQF